MLEQRNLNKTNSWMNRWESVSIISKITKHKMIDNLDNLVMSPETVIDRDYESS